MVRGVGALVVAVLGVAVASSAEAPWLGLLRDPVEVPAACRGVVPRFGELVRQTTTDAQIRAFGATARYAARRPPAASGSSPSLPTALVVLWGKFGLLNNRLRCLANAVSFSARLKATLILHGPWAVFAEAVLDVDHLVDAADVVVAPRGDVSFPAAWQNRTRRLSCADAFHCGGPCGDVARTAPFVPTMTRAGGQRAQTRTAALYEEAGAEPVLCGYAALAPRRSARAEARAFLDKMFGVGPYHAHHQRLETVVREEPVARMCRACAARLLERRRAAPFYARVCDGRARPDDIIVATEDAARRPTPMFLASDRHNRTVFGAWAATPAVVLYEPSARSLASDPAYARDAPSAMFRSRLGAALYASRFRGGPEARRRALADEVAPVLVDMLVLANAAAFWPTPGSTMSETVCFWRKAFHPSVAPVAGVSLSETQNHEAAVSCEELVIAA